MKRFTLAVRGALRDLAKLRLPVTAAATVATVVGLLQPFGIDLSAQTTRITAGLALLGMAAATVQGWTKP